MQQVLQVEVKRQKVSIFLGKVSTCKVRSYQEYSSKPINNLISYLKTRKD
jgi:hypothetical protein